MYLLDTNIISELRRTKPHGAVVAWMRATSDEQLRVAAVSLGEIQAGIEMTRERDPQKADALEKWLAQVEYTYAVIPMDGAVFRAWAKLMHRRSDELMEDAMIAATAIVHQLTVVTRNVRDFKPFGTKTLDPFKP
jgi:predicted nucleic acid-binding protein